MAVSHRLEWYLWFIEDETTKISTHVVDTKNMKTVESRAVPHVDDSLLHSMTHDNGPTGDKLACWSQTRTVQKLAGFEILNEI